uniref:ORF43 n=1 Tax=Malaco herpesvirus 2 TaxID=3031798 RepID=A0AA48SF11_9VIRU|nr:TPA_asm: ORF43 [Malaco herpesvirus 2]
MSNVRISIAYHFHNFYINLQKFKNVFIYYYSFIYALRAVNYIFIKTLNFILNFVKLTTFISTVVIKRYKFRHMYNHARDYMTVIYTIPFYVITWFIFNMIYNIMYAIGLFSILYICIRCKLCNCKNT